MNALTTTAYSYDQGKRLTDIGYSDGTPSVHYRYDAATDWANSPQNNLSGRLATAWVGTGGAQIVYGYDAMGRTTTHSVSVCATWSCDPAHYPMQYQYDLMGNLLSATDGAGNSTNYSYDIEGKLSQIRSSFSETPVLQNASYNAAGLQQADMGNGFVENRSYDGLGRLQSVGDGPGVTTAVAGTGSVTITGSEQNGPSTPGVLSFTINGSEQCTRIDGSTLCDVGTITISVGSYSTYANYMNVYIPGSTYNGDNAADLATTLADNINQDCGEAVAPVCATVSGATVTLTATGTGPGTNYPFSWSAGSGYPSVFSSPSYSISAPSSFSGGAGGPNGIYDSGTAVVQAGGTTEQIAWGQGATAAGIAGALAQAFNSDSNSQVMAVANCNVVYLTARASGAATDSYRLWAAIEGQTMNSFAVTPSGGYLTGGSDSEAVILGNYSYAFGLGYQGNAISSSWDTVNGSWNYNYDALGHLSNAGNGSQTFTYGMDQFANRWNQTGVGTGTAPQPQFTFYSDTNRTDQMSYDALGNVISDGSHSYYYDAENRIVSVDSGWTAGYSYDAEGERASAITSSGTSESLRDLSGNQVALIYNGTYQHTNIYAGQRLLATWAGGLYYHYQDWQGTRRMQTDSSGNPDYTCTNLPFGDGQNCGGSFNATQQGFTGLEYDSETGLNYAHARYYHSGLASFMSADPAGMAAVDSSNPQTLNRYAYVGGDPINHTDPSGMITSSIPGVGLLVGSPLCGPLAPLCAGAGGLWSLFGGIGDLLNGGGGGPVMTRRFRGTLKPRPEMTDFGDEESLGLPDGMQLPPPFNLGKYLQMPSLAQVLGIPSLAQIVNAPMSATPTCLPGQGCSTAYYQCENNLLAKATAVGAAEAIGGASDEIKQVVHYMSTNRAGLGAYAAVGLGNYFALSQGAAATVGTAVGSYLIPAAAVGYTVWRGYQGYKVAKAYMEQNDYTCAGL